MIQLRLIGFKTLTIWSFLPYLNADCWDLEDGAILNSANEVGGEGTWGLAVQTHHVLSRLLERTALVSLYGLLRSSPVTIGRGSRINMNSHFKRTGFPLVEAWLDQAIRILDRRVKSHIPRIYWKQKGR
jgi:hypothetical protein